MGYGLVVNGGAGVSVTIIRFGEPLQVEMEVRVLHAADLVCFGLSCCEGGQQQCC